MALGRVHGGSSPVGVTQVLGAEMGDRRIQLYVTGTHEVRIGFAEADVTQGGAGFAVPPGRMLDFVLADGDELWANGDATTWQSRLYMLVTKVA